MRQSIALPSSFAVFRRLFACCLLLASAALPLQAWAVDTDGDGVDDSIDAFPTYAEATTDTDSDRMPDNINKNMLPVIFSDSFDSAPAPGWVGIVSNSPVPLTGGWALNSDQLHSGSGSLGGWATTGGGKSVSVTLTIPAQGGYVSYWQKKNLGCSGNPCGFQSGGTLFESPIFTSAAWVNSTYALSAGSRQLIWIVKCGGSFPGLCGYLDDVVVRSNSTLVEDTDDDNDTLPDAWELSNGRNPLKADYMVSAGGYHSCALDNTGVKCWGNNSSGQITVPALSSPTVVSAGYRHTCAIDSTGVKCWGAGATNLGTGYEYGQSIVPHLNNPTSVSAGYWHTCAMDATGVHCWGKNTKGQTNVPALSHPVQVAAGKDYSCALDDSGVHCWGINGAGQTNVPALVHPKSISLSVNHACAVDQNGVKCWGNNNAGQLSVPALVSPQMSAVGASYSCALDSGSAVCWGDPALNTAGQLNVPVLNNPATLDAGLGHTCALDSTGVNCWGRKACVKVPPLNFTHP